MILMLLVLTVGGASLQAEDKVKIVLVGDSTTIGGLPRSLKPEGPHLEQMIEILGAAEGLPPLEVINTGKGGETAKRLLESKHYDKAIAPIEGVDLIFVRLGINDWFKCKDLQAEFPVQLKEVSARLRQDHPQARIILSTICRFMAHEHCVAVNDLIKQVATDEKLDLFDLYPAYHDFLLQYGEHSLNIRHCPLKNIPEKYHAWLAPHTWRKGWGENPNILVVRFNDMSLDPILGESQGWYGDRHPNSTGYNLIAAETVKYLVPLLRKKEGSS